MDIYDHANNMNNTNYIVSVNFHILSPAMANKNGQTSWPKTMNAYGLPWESLPKNWFDWNTDLMHLSMADIPLKWNLKMSCGINHPYKSFLSSHLAFRALSAHAFGWAPLNLGRRSRTASSPPRASGRTRGPAGVSRGRSIPKTLLVASAELSNGKNTVPLVSHMWNYMLIFVLNTDECLLDDLMGGPVHLHLYTTLKNFTEMQAGQQTCFRCCIMLHHHQRLAFTNTYSTCAMCVLLYTNHLGVHTLCLAGARTWTLASRISQSSPHNLQGLALIDDGLQLGLPVISGQNPSKLLLPHRDVLPAPGQCKLVSVGWICQKCASKFDIPQNIST